MTNSKRVAEALSAEVERLHAQIDNAIRACIYDQAAKISGVPVHTIKEMLIARSASSYCRCKALKNVTKEVD